MYQSLSRVQLCDPMDYSPPGSTLRGISLARILEWVAIYFSRDLQDSRIEPKSPALSGRFFTTEPPGKPVNIMCMRALSCPSLHNPTDCSPPGQARILEWVVISYSRQSFWPRGRIHVSWVGRVFFTTEPPGKPYKQLFPQLKLLEKLEIEFHKTVLSP